MYPGIINILLNLRLVQETCYFLSHHRVTRYTPVPAALPYSGFQFCLKIVYPVEFYENCVLQVTDSR